MRRFMTWVDAIKVVLAEEGAALSTRKIAARVLRKGLRPRTPTPASTVSSAIGVSIRSGDSPFEKVGVGTYKLRDRRVAKADRRAAAEMQT